LTVIVPTYNRAKTLPDVLDAYCRLRPPPGGWRMTVVDNASTDATRAVIESYGGRLPLKYVFEAKRGVSPARNAGVATIDGYLAVWSDDDAIPEPDWLVRMRAVADAHPDYAIFAGMIRPRWPQPPPQWVLDHVPLDVAFTLHDPAMAEGPVDPHLVWGPNMAI